MNSRVDCLVCLSENGGQCERLEDNLQCPHISQYRCNYCGRFSVFFDMERKPWDLTPVQRATLSCRIRRSDNGSKGNPPFLVTSDIVDNLRASDGLYDPATQASDLIRFIGDHVSRDGNPIDQLSGSEIQRHICAPSLKLAAQIIDELKRAQTIQMIDRSTPKEPRYSNVILTLDGWKQYAAEKHGRQESNYGFIAMAFFDSNKDDEEYGLPDFVNNVVRPAVKDATGYDLRDVRDFGRAGVIDNILRATIRDSKFVIADLSHENRGAYWEAGYAEALGKPVIYICEQQKFDKEKSHFDTNHCTTVPWSNDDSEQFRRNLIATLNRSLDQS